MCCRAASPSRRSSGLLNGGGGGGKSSSFEVPPKSKCANWPVSGTSPSKSRLWTCCSTCEKDEKKTPLDELQKKKIENNDFHTHTNFKILWLCVCKRRQTKKKNRKCWKIIGFLFSFVCFEKVQQNNKKVKLIEKIIFRLTMIASFCFFSICNFLVLKKICAV